MVHPDTELRFISDQIGFGVVATRLIPKGTLTWVRDRLDQSLSLARIDALPEAYRELVHKYSFLAGTGDFVLCWDLARYINHSCEPTCRSAGFDFEVAVRDIAPGEELSDDYGSLNLEYAFHCLCGAPTCRGRIAPGDLLRYADAWDAQVAEPFVLIPTVDQPLWTYLEEHAAVAAVLAGRQAIPSCRAHYCDLTELYRRRAATV